ncbi:regulatory protein RecX [Oscillospiraceae bacterium MB08-C2-2]|nr:regulatory protein RecX [Oscillospiraceae bacterium MB08-C2-2]
MISARITDIHRTKRGRYSVYLDGEFSCVLHEEILAESALRIGQDIDPAELEALFVQSQLKLTKERALGLLSLRAYTCQGLMDKLCERADEDIAAQAVERMLELGLLDDTDYARRCASHLVEVKGYSISRAAQELMRRGIDRETAREVLEELEVDAQPAIAAVIRRKYMSSLEDEKSLRKATNALARLGYSYSDIRKVIENLLEDESYYD